MNIDKTSTVLEIVEKYPESQDYFRSYDESIGKCLMCSHLFDSLEAICISYGYDTEEFIKDLKKSIDL